MRILIALVGLAFVSCASPVPLPGCVAPASKAGTVQKCFQGAIAVDKPTYAVGDTVKIVETATNTCSQPAGAPTVCGPRGIYVTTASGAIVWQQPVRGIACPALAILVPPGGSVQAQTAWPIPTDATRGGYDVVGPPNYGSAGFAVC